MNHNDSVVCSTSAQITNDLYLGRPLLRSFSTISENEQNDNGREKKKSDKDIPDDLSLVGSAGVREEELKEICVCPSCHMIFPSYQSLTEHFSIYHGQNQ
jgi:hypothetical protein